MNNDAISRSAAIADLRDWLYGSPDDEYQEGFDAALLGAIDRLGNENINPALDVEPVIHARWDAEHRCTECICLCTTVKATQGHLVFVETPYCPNCGARMDGDDNGTD